MAATIATPFGGISAVSSDTQASALSAQTSSSSNNNCGKCAPLMQENLKLKRVTREQRMLISKLQADMGNLKDQMNEERKKHSQTNNEIIQLNVKLQQSLNSQSEMQRHLSQQIEELNYELHQSRQLLIISKEECARMTGEVNVHRSLLDQIAKSIQCQITGSTNEIKSLLKAIECLEKEGDNSLNLQKKILSNKTDDSTSKQEPVQPQTKSPVSYDKLQSIQADIKLNVVATSPTVVNPPTIASNETAKNAKPSNSMLSDNSLSNLVKSFNSEMKPTFPFKFDPSEEKQEFPLRVLPINKVISGGEKQTIYKRHSTGKLAEGRENIGENEQLRSGSRTRPAKSEYENSNQETRSRRSFTPISYKEPPLNTKLRKGDPNTFNSFQ